MKEFRHQVLNFWKNRIWSILTFPFDVLKTYSKLKKIDKIPDRWERHMQLRKMENDAEAEKLRYQMTNYVCIALGSVTRMVITMLIALLAENDVNYSEEKTQADFDAEKAETLTTFKQMEEIGGNIPKELWELVENCQLRTYTSEEEISEFGDTVRDMITNVRR